MGEFLLGSQGNRVQWLRLSDLGFPGGPVVKNLPANAGDTCLISLCSKILHALEQLSPGATNTKAHILETVLCNKGTISRRNPHAAMKSSPVRSKWRKQGFTEQRRPSAAKINWFKKKKVLWTQADLSLNPSSGKSQVGSLWQVTYYLQYLVYSPVGGLIPWDAVWIDRMQCLPRRMLE